MKIILFMYFVVQQLLNIMDTRRETNGRTIGQSYRSVYVAYNVCNAYKQ